MQLELKQIRCDGGTQPRTTIHEHVVVEYVETMREGATFPPVTVFYDGKEHWLADGFHRVAAVRKLGLDRIECDVRPGTLSDAQWYSFSVNKSHGLRRTNEDKARAVKAALRHCKGETSDNEIARHVGVGYSMVASHRKTLIAEGEIPSSAHLPDSGRCAIRHDGVDSVEPGEPARVVTRKGTTYPMKTGKIGSTKKPKKFGGISKNAAVPIRKPSELIPTLTVSLPMNNPEAAAKALLSGFDASYLRAMIQTIVTVLKERNL